MEQDELKLAPYARALWRRRWLIVVTTLGALLAGIGAVVLDGAESSDEGHFVAGATLRIEDQPRVDGSETLTALQILTGDGTQSVQTHIEVIQSSEVMGRAVNNILEASGAPLVTDEQLLDESARILAADVRVSQVPGSNLVIVFAEAPAPDVARLRTDSIVSAYQQFLRDQKLAATQDAIAAIDQRIGDASQPELTSARLKLVVEQLFTGDIDRVEQAIESSISQIALLDLSQFADPPSVEGLTSELEAASARLQTASLGLTALEEELTSNTGGSGRESADTARALTSSSLATVRTIQSEYADASLVADVTAGRADLVDANVAINDAENRLRLVGNNTSILPTDRNAVQQLVSQVDALSSINASLASELLLALDSGLVEESDRRSLLTQFSSTASSLRIIITELGVIRQSVTDSGGLAQIVSAEGLLQTAADSLELSAATLVAAIASGPEADLEQVENLLAGTVERLDLISFRFNGNTAGDQLLVADVEGVESALASAAAIVASLRTNVRLQVAPSSANLLTIEPQLRTGTRLLDELAADLQVGSALPSDVLLSRVRQSKESVSAALIESQALESTIAGLDTADRAEEALVALDSAAMDLTDLGLSMISVSQIIDAISAAGVGSQLGSQLSRYSDDLSSAATIFASSSSRMSETAATLRNLPAVLIGSALRDLESARTELGTVRTMVSDLQSKASAGELLTITDGGDVASRLQLVQGSLASAAEDISRVQSVELNLTAQNAQSTEARLRTILSQLTDVEAAETAAIDDLFDVRRDLQILLLGPQETGVALVDTEIEAIPPRNSSPIDIRVVAGGVGGFLLGLIGALILELTDRTVRRSEDIGDIVPVPSLGLLPVGQAKGNPHPPEVTDDPTSVFSEAVHLVTTQVQGRVNNRSRLLLITSPRPREGKTMMAVNLARALALRSLRVLLVDANFRKPDASKILEFGDEPGLADALTQHRDPEEFIKTTEDGQLDVLPAGQSLVPPVELISRPTTGVLLEKVRQRYDFVIIDGPPTLGFAESNALAKQAGGIIVVARSGVTKKLSLREAMDHLSDTDVLGVVMNFASPKDLVYLEHGDYGARANAGKWTARLTRPFRRPRSFWFSKN